MNTEVDIRHKRRALSDTEVIQLIQSARSSGRPIQGFDGETRARIYILAFLTGLRRKELGSLTPESFRLNQKNPTVVVEAACSKHRRMDTLPLHPDLATLLPEWLKAVPPDSPLFPKLGKRKAWLMVKKDLERVGIPYENRDGIADFHAAGRHTHITELLRNGASLAEVKELARHSDIRITMKYAHIGLEDQAKAVAKISWECPGSAQGVISGLSESQAGTADGTDETKKNAKPKGNGTKRQEKAPSVMTVPERRTRGSNPNLTVVFLRNQPNFRKVVTF